MTADIRNAEAYDGIEAVIAEAVAERREGNLLADLVGLLDRYSPKIDAATGEIIDDRTLREQAGDALADLDAALQRMASVLPGRDDDIDLHEVDDLQWARHQAKQMQAAVGMFVKMVEPLIMRGLRPHLAAGERSLDHYVQGLGVLPYKEPRQQVVTGDDSVIRRAIVDAAVMADRSTGTMREPAAAAAEALRLYQQVTSPAKWKVTALSTIDGLNAAAVIDWEPGSPTLGNT